MNEPTIEFLREAFDADPEGFLVWRVRPLHHFLTSREQKLVNTRFAGCVVKGELSKGYRLVRMNVEGKKTRLRIHRVIWALHHGHWPETELDHRDCDRQNNRLGNLRLANRFLQGQNATHPTGVTQLAGAYRNGPGFCSRIKVNGRDLYLGQFATASEANQAYLAAKARHHG
jgi:hypothetical protein